MDTNLQLFACWFDVVGSVTRDLPPQMPQTSMNLDGLGMSADARPARRERFNSLVDDIGNSQSLEDMYMLSLVGILERMAALADFVNQHSSREPGFWKSEDDMRPIQFIGPITHALLSMPRADITTLNRIQAIREMARLAMLILLAGVKAKYGLSAPEMDYLQSKLSTLVSVVAKTDMVLPFSVLQLWCLVIAALLSTGPARGTYVQEISSWITRMNIPDGTGAIATARDVIWIEDIASENAVSSLIFDIDMVYADDQRCTTPTL